MKISVIIPYHNTDINLFKMCLLSVFSQSYQDFEVIIINDGSHSKYITELKDAENSDKRVRVITQKCLGASAARNRGVLEAKGEYISFVDADDMIMPEFLESAMQTIQAYHADMVAGGVRFIYYLEEMRSIFNNKEKLTENEVVVFEGKEIENFKNHLASSRKLIKYSDGNVDRGPVARLLKKELAMKCPFRDNLIMWEDLVWNLELLDKCNKVCAVTKTWYLYYQNPQSQIHKYRPNVINEVEETMSYVKNLLKLNTEEGFETFGDHVYDNLRRIYKLYFSRRECPLTLKERKEEYKRIYSSEPWNVFGADRYYKLTSGKNKLMSFLYRKKLFFLVFGIKEKIRILLPQH